MLFKQEPGPGIGQKVLNYWKPGSQMLSDPTAFLDSLMKYDKESITEDMIKKLKKYVNDPNYEPMKISKVILIFCSWSSMDTPIKKISMSLSVFGIRFWLFLFSI